MSKLELPIRMTATESNEVALIAERLADDPLVDTLDARGCKRIGPLGAAMLAAAAARRSRPIQIVLEPQDEAVARFCDEIGLWQLVRTPATRESVVTSSDTLRLRNLFALDPVFTHQLAELLSRNLKEMTEEASHLVQLCLNETLQNTFEHAGSDVGCFVHGRWYRQDGNVRLAVVDSGIGIAAALRSMPGNEQRADAELVEDAVTIQGVTSRTNRVGGLGLKTIRSIITQRAGRLVLVTGTTKLIASEAGVRWHPSPLWQGTAIEMDFRPGMNVASSEEEFF